MTRLRAPCVVAGLILILLSVPPRAPAMGPEPVCRVTEAAAPLPASRLEFNDIIDVRFLASGGFVVAENEEGRLRFIDPDGRPVVTVGRQGAGPGEYRSIRWVQVLRGDTVAVYDIQQRRLTYLDGRGDLIRTEPIRVTGEAVPQGGIAPVPPGVLALRNDGSVWAHGIGTMRPTGQPGLLTISTALMLLAPDREAAAELGRIGWHDLYETAGTSPRRFEMPPFVRRALISSDGDRLFVAEGPGPEIRVYEGHRQVGTLSAAVPHRPVTAEIRGQYAANEEWPYSAPRAAPFPSAVPAYDALFTDRTGRVWARLYPVPGDRLHRWFRFDATRGAPSVTVCVDAGFRPHDAMDNRILGVWTDEDGVQTPGVVRITGQ